MARVGRRDRNPGNSSGDRDPGMSNVGISGNGQVSLDGAAGEDNPLLCEFNGDLHGWILENRPKVCIHVKVAITF